MTADRAYRTALSPAEARAIIQSGLGTHFDAALGQLFLSLPHLP
jgi:HD-GYP domain-containing protein (c-di-GMP phosphodiesterase class II)